MIAGRGLERLVSQRVVQIAHHVVERELERVVDDLLGLRVVEGHDQLAPQLDTLAEEREAYVRPGDRGATDRRRLCQRRCACACRRLVDKSRLELHDSVAYQHQALQVAGVLECARDALLELLEADAQPLAALDAHKVRVEALKALGPLELDICHQNQHKFVESIQNSQFAK